MYPPKHRHTTGIILGVLVAVLIVGVFSFLYRSQAVVLVDHIVPRCSVGIRGTSTSITFIGVGAEPACQQLIYDLYHYCDNKENCVTLAGYEMSSEPIQPEVCEGDYRGNHVIVRDEGILKIIGNGFCNKFFPSNSTTPT